MSMKTISYLVAPNLYLVLTTLVGAPAARPAPKPTDHVLVIDCSGSMSSDLPRMRQQIKSKLPTLVGEADTVSIVWFSGRSEFGTLVDAAPIRTLKDLSSINTAVDRFLRPVGLTGFKEPFQEAGRLLERLKNPSRVSNLMFLSDGCDNCWNRDEILKVVKGLRADSAAVVEYGYYADRQMLAKLASTLGGQHIFAERFDRYEPEFERIVTLRPSGVPQVRVDVQGDPLGGTAFVLRDGAIMTYDVTSGAASVPADTGTVCWVSPTRIGTDGGSLEAACAPSGRVESAVAAAYAATSLLAVQMQSNAVYAFLRALGDAAISDQFSGCFGKQRYSAFAESTRTAAFDPTKRCVAGYDTSRLPRDDAFTVVDLLRLLESDPDTRLMLDHESFSYSAISRKRVDANSVLTEDEQAEVEALTDEMKGCRDTKKVADLASRIASLTNKPAALRFVPDEALDGYALSDLTLNEDRPNVSVLIRKAGSVDISERLAASGRDSGTLKLGSVPPRLSTFIWRNYTLVKDGLVNVAVLPTRIGPTAQKELLKVVESGRLKASVFEPAKDGLTLIRLDQIPVVCRNQVTQLSADQFFRDQFEIVRAKAAQKVINSLVKDAEDFLFTAKSDESYAALYGTDAANWLQEQGFGRNGFAPKQVVATVSDFYMSRSLKVKFKGYSTLPSMNDLRKGKLNGPGKLMQAEVEALAKKFPAISSTGVLDTSKVDQALLTELKKVQGDAVKRVRGLLATAAQYAFTIVVGQAWFKEFKSLDENTYSFEPLPGLKVDGTVETVEEKIQI